MFIISENIGITLDDVIRVSGIVDDSIVDGPGLRLVIFTQGCRKRCKGCHNPQTWDLNGGYDISIRDVLERIKRNPLIMGVTFSGGEPFLQARKLSHLASLIKSHAGVSCMSYTGYIYEWIVANATSENGYQDLLDNIDYLVDGEYIESERSYDLLFRGSRNQRIIDVQKSILSGTTVLADI